MKESEFQVFKVEDSVSAAFFGRWRCHVVFVEVTEIGFGSNLTVFTAGSASGIAQRAVSNWANSPGHLRTMLDPDCDSIGVGITVSGGRTYCYMFVGNPTANPSTAASMKVPRSWA